jgi:hypothetical protein
MLYAKCDRVFNKHAMLCKLIIGVSKFRIRNEI